MREAEKQAVNDIIECEGFDYAFRHYSSFEEIKDEQFHTLRKAYREAANELESYIELDGDIV